MHIDKTLPGETRREAVPMPLDVITFVLEFAGHTSSVNVRFRPKAAIRLTQEWLRMLVPDDCNTRLADSCTAQRYFRYVPLTVGRKPGQFSHRLTLSNMRSTACFEHSSQSLDL